MTAQRYSTPHCRLMRKGHRHQTQRQMRDDAAAAGTWSNGCPERASPIRRRNSFDTANLEISAVHSIGGNAALPTPAVEQSIHR
jgi:hypothetical protein